VIDGEAGNVGFQLVESFYYGFMLGIPDAHISQWVSWEQLLILNQFQAPNHPLSYICLFFNGLGLFLSLYVQGAAIVLDAEFADGAILIATEEEVLLGANRKWQTFRLDFLECADELNRLLFNLNNFDSAIITCQVDELAYHLWAPDRTTCIELRLDSPFQQIPLNDKSVKSTAQ